MRVKYDGKSIKRMTPEQRWLLKADGTWKQLQISLNENIGILHKFSMNHISYSLIDTSQHWFRQCFGII